MFSKEGLQLVKAGCYVPHCRSIALWLLLSALTVACGGGGGAVGKADGVADTLTEAYDLADDSLWTDAEEAADEIETEAEVPASVDSLFDDFAFAFDANERLQQRRVAYPITVTTDTSVTTYDRRQWHHPTLFLGLDYCTVLWNSEAELQRYEAIRQSTAAIEHISLHRRTITAYHFERDTLTEQWHLVAESETSFDRSELGSFLDFYRRWSTDSVFQQQHVAHTLRYTLHDENSEEGVIDGFIAAEQWPEFAPEVPMDMLVNVRYGQTYSHPSQIVMQVRGLSNSLQNLLTFRRDGQRWRLTAFQN